MLKLSILRRTLLLVGLCFLFVLGCASSPKTRFYTLSSLQERGKEPKNVASDQGLIIVLGPVKFSEYLDRTEIVTRSSSNRINFSDFDAWASPLSEDFTRVLAENLSTLLSTNSIILYPRPRRSLVDYQITVDVIRFDGPLGGDISLIARWSIFDGKEKKLLTVRKSKIVEPSGAQGYEAMVVADSRALEKLSREIAEAIRTVQK